MVAVVPNYLVMRDRQGLWARVPRRVSLQDLVNPTVPMGPLSCATAIYDPVAGITLKNDPTNPHTMPTNFADLPEAVAVHPDDEAAIPVVLAYKDDASGFYCGLVVL